MLSERGAGDLASVAADIEAKLIRRHPHIFADGRAEHARPRSRRRWERIKVEQEGREGIFHDVPGLVPGAAAGAQAAAARRQRRLRLGLGRRGLPQDRRGARRARRAVRRGGRRRRAADAARRRRTVRDPDRHDPRVAHEVGDLLFAIVNVARLLHVDPELALREAARRFERRVTAAAALAAAEGGDWAALDLPQQEDYYQRAKAGETAAASSE